MGADPYDMIQDVKIKIQNNLFFDGEFVFHGQRLRDDSTLSDYNIQCDDTVWLNRLREGPQKHSGCLSWSIWPWDWGLCCRRRRLLEAGTSIKSLFSQIRAYDR